MIKSFWFIPFLLTISNACGIYSFTGTTTNAESITISRFFSDTSIGPPNLGATFTDQLKDYFQQNTSLVLLDDGGELLMEGSVSSYRLAPVAPSAAQSDQARDVANLTRLTIIVKVEYVNLGNEDFNFSRNFSQYADFDSDLGITAVETELIEEIFEQIILDIFNASVANW